MAFDGEFITEAEWAKFRRETMQSLPAVLVGKSLPDILMPSQKALLLATASHQVVVADKSRRIGFTWAVGADAVLTSGAAKSAGGMDTLYIGTSMDMAREFIDACAMWARAFMPACTEVGEFLFADEDEKGDTRQILAFRIAFASGFEIVALSSRPRSLRGRQGYVILDEFAFHDDAEALLKAAMALLIWGGKVLVVSTHNGVDNPFNQLIQDIRAKKRPGAVVRCTFDDAVREGLYQRICLIRGKEWTPEGEAAWMAGIYAAHGADADEELRCIPSQGGGVYITRASIEACSTAGGPERVLQLTCKREWENRPQAERRSFVNDWLEEHVAPWLRVLDPKLRHCFGMDFALTGDVSCYVPIAIERDLRRSVPFTIEMNCVPYDQQKQIVTWVTERLPRFSGAKMDARGNGAVLAQETSQRFSGMVDQVQLSAGWYQENMPILQAAYVDRTVSHPRHADLVDDVRQIKLIRGTPKVPDDARTTGSNGEQRHGDFGIALCLALAATYSDYVEYDYTAVPRASAQPGQFHLEQRDDDVGSFTGRGVGAIRGTW